MGEVKKLGIWMCHSNVHLVEYTNEIPDPLLLKEVAENHLIETSEATRQNEAFHIQTESFKKLGTAIENYSEVLLFGPIDVKLEFLKFLKADTRFDQIKIDVQQTNEMSEDQQQVFVSKHFSGNR